MEDFWRHLVDSHRLIRLIDFENRNRIFPAVHAEQKFCLLTVAGSAQPRTSGISIGFWLTDPDQLGDPERVFALTVDALAYINPNTRQPPVCRTRRDFALVTHIQHRTQVVRRTGDSQPAGTAWRALTSAGSSADFKMSGDLVDGVAQRDGTVIFEGRTYVPLLEAKLIHQYDHAFATFDRTTSEMQRTGDPRETTIDERDPTLSPVPRFWASTDVVAKMYSDKDWRASWIIGLRDVTNVNNERTAIAAALPAVGLIQPLNAVTCRSAAQACFLVGALNSFVLDYVARQKVAGRHLNITISSQLPIPEVTA